MKFDVLLKMMILIFFLTIIQVIDCNIEEMQINSFHNIKHLDFIFQEQRKINTRSHIEEQSTTDFMTHGRKFCLKFVSTKRFSYREHAWEQHDAMNIYQKRNCVWAKSS